VGQSIIDGRPGMSTSISELLDRIYDAVSRRTRYELRKEEDRDQAILDHLLGVEKDLTDVLIGHVQDGQVVERLCLAISNHQLELSSLRNPARPNWKTCKTADEVVSVEKFVIYLCEWNGSRRGFVRRSE
jgi:hypothetical protein